MALTPGTRLGVYEVTAPIGEGGMGQVYRATDTTLGRQVAIKILPDAFASDPERLARFEREAKTLASLNHPHIAAIYAVEKSGGLHALVMELVEGEDLSQRIARGAIPIDEALPIAKQIAEALEAAHEQGIIHRDLKPANIKVRPDGTVKVLDFGLAKAMEPVGSAPNVSQSPTITTPTMMTNAGVILGTAAYMAPEQARGKPVDKRADIWAFGCVLYEMLTGRRAFEGEEVSDTLAAVLRGEPNWASLPSSTPRTIRRLIRRCLEKDRRERLQAIGDARLEIKEALTAAGGDEGSPASGLSMTRRLAPVGAAVVVTALAAGGATWLLKPSPDTAPSVTRSLISVQPFDRRSPAKPGESRLPAPRPDRTDIAISPDGRTLVFRALGNGPAQLFVRPLDRLDATPLAGTEGAESPFFSADGGWVGFWVSGEIKKIPLAGGVASAISRVPGAGTAPRIYGASWAPDDVIAFATPEGLWTIGAAGGQPQQVTTPSANEYRHVLPQILPGGRGLLFTLTRAAFRWDDAQIVVRALKTGEQKLLIDNGADARYVSSGHLVFARQRTLMAVPFDLARLEVTGGPVALLEGVMQAVNAGNTGADSGAAQVAIAENGTMVYATGGAAPDRERALVWVDRDGRSEPLKLPNRAYAAPRLAPDGQRLAVSMLSMSGTPSRVWVHDVLRGGLTAVTSNQEAGFWNIWTPDGRRVVFAAGVQRFNWKPADGTGAAETLHTSRIYVAPSSWSTDGRLLVFIETHATTGNDIWLLDVSGPTRQVRPLVQTDASETYPAFSPDTRWIAYTSNHSGRAEVYVQPYPGPGGRVQVSIDGGSAPAWRGDGRELFFVGPSAPEKPDVIPMMAVSAEATAGTFVAGTPRTLFEGRYALTGPVRGYDVTPDGRRFLMVQQLDPPPAPPGELVLVDNWHEELKRLVPTR